jgi:hypothetical protein
MRKLIIGAATAAMLFGNVALAKELSITASITYIDVKARIIVIDHRAFHVPTTVNIGILHVGEQVTVVYEVVDGQLRIVSIRIG